MKRTSLIATMAMALMASLVINAQASAAQPVNMANRNEFAVQGSAPVTNTTPIENGFACFATNYLTKTTYRPVFSVGHIADQTGKFSNEASAGGFESTQGLANMVYTAMGKLSPSDYGNFPAMDKGVVVLGKDGAPLPSPEFSIVERTDTSIPDSEIGLTKQTLLSDASESNGLRHLRGGQVIGTDYYITGAVTEINYNVDSGGAEGYVNQIGGGKRVYMMEVALDLRIVDAKTLRIVKTVSERKIIRGYEVKTGVFNFLGIYLIDISAGRKAEEPFSLGVRSAMESALLKLVGAAYQTSYGSECADWAAANYGKVTKDTLASAQVVPLTAGAAKK
jgi:curli biogenesis system outer membrane secretion channel CsgG